ncbi:MAG: tRNA (adenosine(37)-N6)-threonylcarbamoyltransferase complex ATPase subunit type 1 TsaE, partial [Acidobacteriota bacterium]|nr:tRNA (adenosine(37)-N6)-threonylcarbamoyltransferase complex ATPase subunit type 1 TsaE [Acidobacteriota bacterium]
AAEADDLGLDEHGDSGVLVVEWPDRWTRPVDGHVRVVIERRDGDARTITILAPHTP